MTHNDDSSLRVLVSGMMKRPVRRSGKGGIIDEDNLSRFFNDAGCKVAGVRLVVDAKRDKIRGFGFVDFNDYKSLDLALKLHNKEAKGLAGKDGKLRIERKHAATDEGRTRQQELPDAGNPTEELERTLAFHAARINELVREVVRKQCNEGNGVYDEPAPRVLRHELERRDSCLAAGISRALLEGKASGPSSTDGSMDGSTDGSTATISEEDAMTFGPCLGDIAQVVEASWAEQEKGVW